MTRFVTLGVILATVGRVAAAQSTLSASDRAQAFKAAGFTQRAGAWRACDDPGTASYQPGSIEAVRDLNGDGRPEAVIVESSTFCFGNTGTGYSLVSKQANGGWRLITAGPGVVKPLATKGVNGWPDLEIGGPGFCHPVQRWNGRAYAVVRHQYEGKACRPG